MSRTRAGAAARSQTLKRTSSMTRMDVFFSRARAKQNSWRWPTDQLEPSTLVHPRRTGRRRCGEPRCAPPLCTPETHAGPHPMLVMAGRTLRDERVQLASLRLHVPAQVHMLQRLPNLGVGVLVERVQVGSHRSREEHRVLRDWVARFRKCARGRAHDGTRPHRSALSCTVVWKPGSSAALGKPDASVLIASRFRRSWRPMVAMSTPSMMMLPS